MTDTEFSLAEIERLAAGHHHDPHSILGAHPGPHGVVIRALRPTGHLGDGGPGGRPPVPHVRAG